MTIMDRRALSLISFTLLLGVFVTSLGFTPALARKEDSEPGVSDTFGRKNKRVSSGSTKVRAVNAALLKNFDDAFSLARQARDPLTNKLVEWIYLRKEPKKAGYARLNAFVRNNPTWPRLGNLKSFAERRLLWGGASMQTLANHFRVNRPYSSAGYAALAKLELSRGNKKAARKAVLRAWMNPKLGDKTKATILSQLRGLLTRADHERRLWILIHAQKTNAAISTAGLISRQHVQAAKAAQALIRRRSNALTLYKRLPSSVRGKLAIKYALARYYRKKGNFTSALNILTSVSSKTSGVYDQAAWWVERRLVIRELLGRANKRHWKTLYTNARRHGFSRGKHFEEGEFLSGWIALRKLGRAKTAVGHFTKLASRAKSRTQKSRGAYWAGRAYLVLGDKANADKYYKRAARTPTLFYALLAREALGQGRKPIPIRTTNFDKATKNKVARLELVRAVSLLKRAGGNRELGSFVWPISRKVKTRAQASAAASIMHSLGGSHLSLRLAKAVGAYGIDIDNWSYPIRAMPKIKVIRGQVERSVVYALARQESEFSSTARSYVGARGLMQIMPATGRWLGKKYKLRHSTGRLILDPSYNVMMGTAYLSDIIANFNGSYIMSFAGYNAGPGNAKKWVKMYGDPRHNKLLAIDWIESIPLTETRKYVQKVMQNVHIYRSRLNPRAMTNISTDLARGTPPSISSTGKKKANAKCGNARSLTALIQGCN